MPAVQYRCPNRKIKFTVIPSIREQGSQGSGRRKRGLRRISRLIDSFNTQMFFKR